MEKTILWQFQHVSLCDSAQARPFPTPHAHPFLGHQVCDHQLPFHQGRQVLERSGAGRFAGTVTVFLPLYKAGPLLSSCYSSQGLEHPVGLSLSFADSWDPGSSQHIPSRGEQTPLSFLSGGTLHPPHPTAGEFPSLIYSEHQKLLPRRHQGSCSCLTHHRTGWKDSFWKGASYLVLLWNSVKGEFGPKLQPGRYEIKFCVWNWVLSCGRPAGGGGVRRTGFKPPLTGDGHLPVTFGSAFWIFEEELLVRSFWQFLFFFLKTGSFTKIFFFLFFRNFGYLKGCNPWYPCTKFYKLKFFFLK